MNSEKQDGFFGRIRMTAGQDEMKQTSASFGSCTLFSYTDTPSSFFIAKLSYFLFICVLIFGLFVTADSPVFTLPLKAFLLGCLILPPVASSLRAAFSSGRTFDGMFVSIFAALFILFDRYEFAVSYLLIYHLFDTFFYCLITRAARFDFPVVPLTSMKFISRSAEGKCSVGDTVALVQGDFVPADGVVVSGKCTASSLLLSGGESLVFRVGDRLSQGFVLSDGSVHISLSALPSASYFTLYRNRICTLTSQLLHPRKSMRLTFALSSLLAISGFALAVLRHFNLLSPSLSVSLLLVAAFLSVPLGFRLTTLLSLRTFRAMISGGFVPATPRMIHERSFPYAELESLVAGMKSSGDEKRIAVKEKGEKRCVSSEDAPLQFLAAKRHRDCTQIALNLYSTEGLSEGAAVLHSDPLPALRLAKESHRLFCRKKIFLLIVYLLSTLSSVSLAALSFRLVFVLIPFLLTWSAAFIISFFFGRKKH